MDKTRREQREDALREWREVGDRIKAVTERLVEAFQSGWREGAPPAAPAELSEELRAAARQLVRSARAVREAAEQEQTREELGRLGELAKRAVADTGKVIRQDVEAAGSAFTEPEHC